MPEGVGDSTATINIAGGERSDISSDRQLNPVDAAAVDALPLGSALLVVQRGPGAGSRFLLDKDVTTAGRHADSEIFLDDVTVSRRHATFTREGVRAGNVDWWKTRGFIAKDAGTYQEVEKP